MLFKDLNPNYPIFVFDKSETSVKEGKVVNKGLPHFDMLHNTTSQMVTDVTIKIGDVTKTYTFKDDTEVGYAENLVISPNRDVILREVESIKDRSEQVLNQIDLHKTTVEKCNKILSEFNPVFKERKETEQRFSKLETSVEDIKTMISNLTNTINTNNNGQV